MTMVTNAPQPAPIPAGTRVLNTTDGEPGTVLNGYGWDPRTGEWTEYEVETAQAIEIWTTGQFIRFDELAGDAE